MRQSEQAGQVGGNEAETLLWGRSARPRRTRCGWQGCLALWYDCAAAHYGTLLPPQWRKHVLTQATRAREMAALKRKRRELPQLRPEELRQAIVWFWLVRAPQAPGGLPARLAGIFFDWHRWQVFRQEMGGCIEAEGIVGACGTHAALVGYGTTRTGLQQSLQDLLQMLEVRSDV